MISYNPAQPVLSFNFIAGFLEADGSFYLVIEGAADNKTKYRNKTSFIISNKDKHLLELVKQSLGFGTVEPEKDNFRFIADSFQDAQQIVSLFEGRFHGIGKQNFFIFKEAVKFVQLAEAKTLAGHRKFVELMFLINSKGKDRIITKQEWAKRLSGPIGTTFDYLNLEAINYANTTGEPISHDWLSGYAQGDGSHFITKSNDRWRANFTLTDLDKNLLEKIKAQIESSSDARPRVVPFDPGTSPNNMFCYRFVIDAFQAHINWTIPHFDDHPLTGRKQERYILWHEAVILLTTKKNTDPSRKQKLEQIHKLLTNLK